MALRPKSFSIPSSTQLKITFTDKLSKELNIDNFVIESLSGSVDDLEVVGLEIKDDVILLKTRPQVSGNYYLLRLIDTDKTVFLSERGERLIDDSVSRELFFVGIDKVNPIRDRMFERIPSLFSLENSNLKNILSAQAEEIYTAQKKIGELLSDNYISIDVTDEFRVRGPGATDRLANEQAYEIQRVSRFPTGSVPKHDVLRYTKENNFDLLRTLPSHPISLQQNIIEDEIIDATTLNNNFDGFLITTSKNVIKLLSLTVIRASDKEDCYGKIGTEYNIKRFKYAISNNYYDQEYAFSNSNLKDNQILLSEFGNLPRLTSEDTVSVSYVTKDNSRSILVDSVRVSKVETKSFEPVPTNVTKFYLEKAPVVNFDNEIPIKNGLKFYTSENDNSTPIEFRKEIPFNISKLPSLPGEYSVNYNTGEVYLVGDGDRQGTGRNNYVVSYLYRREFKENLDYSISGTDLVANPGRNLAGKEVEISLNYESVFAKDIDYKFNSHIEVMGEHVENRISQSFALETKHSPITNVYRIYNQTTGEVYNPLYHTNTEVFFSGNRSPEIKISESESAKFKKISNDDLEIIGELVLPAFEGEITSNLSNNSLEFRPGIPAELLSLTSPDYILRENSIEGQDYSVRFFGDPDGNNLITSLAIQNNGPIPAIGTKFFLGNRAYIIKLKEPGVLNQRLDALAFFANTSLVFGNKDIFINEKFFSPILESDNSHIRSQKLQDNLSRLRHTGDYTVDYKNGLIYLSVSLNQGKELGTADYYVNQHQSSNSNIFNILNVSKKSLRLTNNENTSIVYNNVEFSKDSISILDLEPGFVSFDGVTTAADLDGEYQDTCIVLDDYTVVVPYYIKGIAGIYKFVDFVGANLKSSSQPNRLPEKPASLIKKSVTSGGGNLYNSSSITFQKNVIDLKKKVRKRAYSHDDNFNITINDGTITSFYEAKLLSPQEKVLFDAKLNISKISNIKITSVEHTDINSVTVSVISTLFDEIDADNDYLLDSNGNRFKIIDLDNLRSEITLSSPAENNPLAISPSLDLNGEASSIIVKPEIEIVDGKLNISIPKDSGIAPGELLEITYLTTSTPDIGTPLVVDYHFGDIYFDYNYVYDQIAIWYEYGDNEIDWSISSSLQEGDEYFVSYRYGANREALRRNFGTLTQIPFFQRFPLEVNRELYRKGIGGVLQAFPKGPTVPAFENLISSFTDIKPEISEINSNSWVLGRDYTYPNTVNAEGDLKFTDGKFGSGLLFDKKTSVSIPAISNISLKEGTLETWIRPDWSGINNDATLTFSLDGIGEEKYVLNPKSNPFNLNWKLPPVSQLEGIVDTEGLGVRISNFKTDQSGDFKVGHNGLFKAFKRLNRITKLESISRFRVIEFGSHINRSPIVNTLNKNITLASKLLVDDYLIHGVNLGLDLVTNNNQDAVFEIENQDITTKEVSNFRKPIPTRSCNCSINLDSNLDFGELTIQINLNAEYSLQSFKANYEVLEGTATPFVIIDDNQDIYQLIAFIDKDQKVVKNSIPDSIQGLIVERFPLNNQWVRQAEVNDLNSLLPTGSISLFCRNVKILGNLAKSKMAFNHHGQFILNWSEYHDYKMVRDPLNNLVNYYLNDNKFSAFYTDGMNIDDCDFIISDEAGIYLGIFNSEVLSSLNIYQSKGTFYNRFNLSNIFIGKNGYHPNKPTFSINREDDILSAIGLSPNTDEEGIFIGFDELCTSPLSDERGQWVFRTRASRHYSVPVDVVVTGPNEYFHVFDTITIGHVFSGNVTTDGEFSSVINSTRVEVGEKCQEEVICDSTFRYCGNDLLETFGWQKLEAADSDLINTVVGGRTSGSATWRKEGTFHTQASHGIYRAGPSVSSQLNMNSLSTILPCSGGNSEYTISLKVADFDVNILNSDFGKFSGAVIGNLIGITPIHIKDTLFDFKVSLALNNLGESLVAILDGTSGKFVDLARYEWNDNSFHEFKTLIDYKESLISLYADNLLISQSYFSEFDSPEESNEDAKLAIHVFDGDLLDSESYHSQFNGNIIDIDFLYFSGFYSENNDTLNDNNIFIHTDDRIDFEFEVAPSDGYLDSYDSYQSYDGYSSEFGVNEVLITSDKLRYIFDTGKSEGEGRISLFKDGKGFLNFRIFENSLTRGAEAGMFNIATSIKDFHAGELHHVAISWKLNSLEGRDELHLFLDGKEVPNLYRFGGKVPVRLNAKYSDVSKETLQSFLVREIIYPDQYSDGTVTASLSLFRSNSITFTEDMIGRSLVIYDAPLATDLIGGEFIIKSVTNGAALLGRGGDIKTIEFTTSDSNITFAFAPYTNEVLTDVRNSRFFVFRTDAQGREVEMGGVLYQVLDGEIDIISGQNIINPQYRVNVDSRLIEFIGQNSDCQYFPTVQESDIDVHLKTFGLNLEYVKNTVQLSSSSYHNSDLRFSGQSVLSLHEREPVDLRDVLIKRIILDRTAIDIISPTQNQDNTYEASFEIDLEPQTSKVSSSEGNIYRQNLGRRLSIIVDSDNINFCNFDGYQDAYQDGYLDAENNTITIYGKTTDGINEETFFVRRNGEIQGSKFFTQVDKVIGKLNIIDPDYFELGVISIVESDYLSVSNNGGDALEVADYQDGHFILVTQGSNQTLPFELHPGSYLVEYPTYLSIHLNEVGRELFIGTDFNKQNHFGGSIDEFRIISECSSDTRETEAETTGTRSVTTDFYLPHEFCPDEQTLALIHFNNPIEKQIRKLRNKEFLNTESNFKYKLTREQQESLIVSANSEEQFIKKMINYGFSYNDAYQTYIEVHHADGGPLWNEAKFYKNYLPYVISSQSVNDSFGHSALFVGDSHLLLDNDEGIFRKEEGTIEFWVSPIQDTLIDQEIRYYLDIGSSRRVRVTSTTSTIIELPNPASKILKVELITQKSKDRYLYSSSEANKLHFDEIQRSQISGRLEGGTGVQKDFSIGHKLSPDGRKIFLADALPGVQLDIVVTYIPLGSQGDRVSVFKNEHSQLVFAITAAGIDNMIVADINWKKNTWHRVKLTYRTNSNGDDFIRVYVDGEDGGFIRYGTGIIYGTGYVYGQYIFEQNSSIIEYRIPLKDDLKMIAIGSNIYGEQSAYSRMDNIRFSRVLRDNFKTTNGFWIDTQYSSNTNTVRPVVADDATTLLLDFDSTGELVEQFASLVDPQNGIFNFKVDVIDNFDKVIGINNGMIEDLIVELVNKLKPAHTNAYVKFKKSNC